MDNLKEHIVTNGFIGYVTLAVDKKYRTCNLHDGNNRLTAANELELEWIPAKIISLSLGQESYKKYQKLQRYGPHTLARVIVDLRLKTISLSRQNL